MRRIVAVGALSVAALAAPPARAQAASTAPLSSPAPGADAQPPVEAGESNAWETQKATRRYGFTMGVGVGLLGGSAAGYPNDYGKIDNAAYKHSTTGLGNGSIFWFGGTLTDWFTFGLGGSTSSFGGSDLKSSGGAFLFHIEAFPLFALGGTFRDVGVLADFGAGSASIVDGSKARIAGGGASSIAGAGVFWEPWHTESGHWNLGPIALWQYQGSDSLVRNVAMLGVRGAFYGGP